MTGKKEENWHENYQVLHRHVGEHQHLPQKTVVEGRGLLNWWKYNKKMPESREAVGGANTDVGSAERDDFDGAYGRQKEENVTTR